MAVIAGGEARDPQRDLPYALLIAIAVVTVFYMLIQLVAIGTFPELAGSTRPIADAAGRFLGPRGAMIMTAGALVSILGNLNVILLTASRLPFAVSRPIGAAPRQRNSHCPAPCSGPLTSHFASCCC